MKHEVLEGVTPSNDVKASVKQRVQALKGAGGNPKLCVVLVGENPASEAYVSRKEKACSSAGIEFELSRFPETARTIEVVEGVRKLNSRSDVHGVIIQLPLPDSINAGQVLSSLSSEKDVDCLTSERFGAFIKGEGVVKPCTPKGVMKLLEFHGVDLQGLNAVVIGRSNLVGKGVASLLLEANASVTVCHSKTKDLQSFTKRADLLVVSAGRPGLITKEFVKEGAVVVDVGINRVDGKLVGDVSESVREVASVSPVPGGVGPLTVASLLENVVLLAEGVIKKEN